jgi:hypothetical protein
VVGFIDVAVGTGFPMVNVSALEVPPPGVEFTTVTDVVPLVAISAAVMAACKLVLETKVVVRGLPFHCTVEEEIKPVPVTVSVNAAPPACALVGFSDVAVGTGFPMVNVSALEVPPPGVEFTTVTDVVPLVAISAAVMAACKLVLETKVVVRGLPFHCTVEEEIKPVPVTVSVNAAPPACALAGFSDVAVGAGLLMVNVSALEVPPPGVGFITVTDAVPAVAMSAAVMAACKLVLETKVVVRALPFHCTTEEATKLVPVTLNENAAPPADTELGFNAPVASDGTGLLVEPPACGGPLHPESHVETARHSTDTATTKFQEPGCNPNPVSSDIVLKDHLGALIAPPRVESVLTNLSPSFARHSYSHD